MSSVLAIILNWRTAEMTLRSAEAARLAMTGLRGAITIVDNDSQDGSFEWLSRAVHQRGWDQAEVPVHVVQSGWNGGFGAGNNVGIRGGLPNGDRPDYLYILNSDAFPEPDAIRRLHDYLDTHPKVGFAGSAILGEKGDIHHTAFRFPSVAGELEQAARTGPITRILRRAVIAPPLPQHSGPVDWLAGASMMMEKRAKVGDALMGGISWRCRVAVNSLLRKGYATCQRLPSPTFPIHLDLALTRLLMSFARERAS